MYELIKTIAEQRTNKVMQPASYRNTRKRLVANIVKVMRYNRFAKAAVSNSHLIVKLLEALRPNPHLPLFEFHTAIRNRYLGVAHSQGLTTAVRRGKVLRGEFFGGKIDEYIIAVDEPIDLLVSDKEWSSYTPVRVLRHPIANLTYSLLDGKNYTTQEGVAVIQVDLMKLALQFRYWYLLQNPDETEWMETIRQFATQYPLSNAIPSMIDCSMLNRFILLYDGGKAGSEITNSPTPIQNVDRELDAYLIDRMVYLTRVSLTFGQMLLNLQPALKASFVDVVKPPETYINRQLGWALTASVIPAVRILLDIDNDTPGDSNSTSRGAIRRYVREALADNALPPAVKEEVLMVILPKLNFK